MMTRHSRDTRRTRPRLGWGTPPSLFLLLLLLIQSVACTTPPTQQDTPSPEPSPDACAVETPTPLPITPEPPLCTSGDCLYTLRINELMPDNEGAYIDEEGQTDDWIELYNSGDQPFSLLGFALSDRPDEPHLLPDVTIPAGGTVIVWADEDLEQGPIHVDFKLSAGGETVYLWAPDGTVLDQVTFPALAINDAWMRVPDGTGEPVACRFATPARKNEQCGPPPPPSLSDDVTFCPYLWPDPWPALPHPLVINELALRPARFIELVNSGPTTVRLADYSLRIAAHAPGTPWPGSGDGTALSLPDISLPVGEMVAVAVTESQVADVAARAGFEGVVTVFSNAPGSQGTSVDRVDFIQWPAPTQTTSAILARQPTLTGPFTYCANASPGEANEACTALESRDVGSYLRALHTPSDFAQLAAGEPKLGLEGVKFIVDLDMGNQVYLLNSSVWDLHYTFVREVIEGQAHLDRCDPEQAAEFNAGWGAFSEENYFTVEGRRYLLGWLSRYGSNDLHGVEFSTGDEIVASQMAHAFFTAVARTPNPKDWYVHAADARQTNELLSIGGQVPAIGVNAAYTGITYQPLNEGVTYGVLEFIPSTELATAPLGTQIIVLTDEVPLDIGLVAGVITEAFQTPLSHVAILSKNRGTPNMSLVDAHTHPEVAPFLGKLVRFEVSSGDFSIQLTTPEEANAFWESQQNNEPPLVPALDLTPTGIQVLEEKGLEDLPSIGAKAAQLAELMRLSRSQTSGEIPIHTHRDAFAIPVKHYLEHFVSSGAAARLAQLQADPSFQADPTVRAEGLEGLRALIREYPVEPALLATVEAHVEATFGTQSVRFRSSSNTEDIPGFSGAGLYTSVSGAVGDKDESIEAAMRTVWASLWNTRAYEEREFYHIAQDLVAMAILCHEAFPSEKANGVGISRNVLDPTRSSYYFNVQYGEAAVTNPAPGIVADEMLYRFGIEPPEWYLAYSSFQDKAAPTSTVLSADELETVMLTLKEIHNYFRPLLDPTLENAYFAMDIEFKLLGESRELLVKQARPFSYGKGVTDACE